MNKTINGHFFAKEFNEKGKIPATVEPLQNIPSSFYYSLPSHTLPYTGNAASFSGRGSNCEGRGTPRPTLSREPMAARLASTGSLAVAAPRKKRCLKIESPNDAGARLLSLRDSLSSQRRRD